MNLRKILCTLIILLFIPISFAEDQAPKIFYNYGTLSYGLKDSSGKTLIDGTYDSIDVFSDDYAVVTLDNLYGVIDQNGKVIIEPIYQYIDRYTNGVFIAKSGHLLGGLNNRGEVIIPFEYDNLSPFRKNAALALKDDKIGLINKRNAIIHDFVWDNVSIVSSDVKYNTFVYTRDGLDGLADFDGKILIKESETALNHFSDTLVAFNKDQLLGIMNFDKEIILEADYSDISEVDNGFLVLKDGYYKFLDYSGKQISGNYLSVTKLNDFLFSFYDGKASGLFNLNEKKEVLPAIYSRISIMKNADASDSKYVALKVENFDDSKPSKVSLADFNGNILIKPAYNSIKFINENLMLYYDENLNYGVFNVLTRIPSGLIYKSLAVDKTNNYLLVSNSENEFGLLDENGKVIIEPSMDSIVEKGGIFLAIKNNKFAIYSKENKKLSKYKFDFFHGFKPLDNDFVSIIRSDGKYGIIKNNGTYLVSPYFDYIEEFRYGYSVFTYKGKTGLLDKTGSFSVDPIYDEIYLISDSLAIFKLDGKFGYIKTDGSLLIDAKFDSASKFNDFGYAVVGIDGKKALINKNGEILTDFIYDSIGEFENGLAKVTIDGNLGLINTKGVYFKE